MNNIKSQKNIPDGWLTINIGELATISRGGSPRPIESYITNDKDGLNWLRIGDINPGAKYIYGTSQKIRKEGLSKTTLVNSGDFILSNSMSFGRPYIMKVSACIHDGWLALRKIKTDLISKDFLYYLLSSKKIQNDFISISAGSGVQNLKKDTVSTVAVKIPLVDEQERIVAVLESWDHAIEKLAKKIKVKKNIKKGLMQNLLTGKVRLSGFKDEWQLIKLSDVCKRIRTGKLDANAMISGGKYRFYTCAKNYYRINEYAFDTEALLVSGNGANVGYIHYYKGKFNAYQRTYVLDNFVSDIIFTKYILDEYLHKRIFEEKCDGNTPYIKMDTLTDMKIKIPKAKEEQRKIADVIETSDEEIKALEKKLTILKNQKKYLLNNLITGTIRTKA